MLVYVCIYVYVGCSGEIRVRVGRVCVWCVWVWVVCVGGVCVCVCVCAGGAVRVYMWARGESGANVA